MTATEALGAAAIVLLLLAGCVSPVPGEPASPTTGAVSPSSSPRAPIPFPQEHSRFYKTPFEVRLNRSFVEEHDLFRKPLQLQPNVSIVATYDVQIRLNQTLHVWLNWTAQDFSQYPPEVQGIEFTPHYDWVLEPGWANLTLEVAIRSLYPHHGQHVTITPNIEHIPYRFPTRQQGFYAILL